MTRRANYKIVKEGPGMVVLRDLGPWDKFLTITNAAEEVVQEMINLGRYQPGGRILYYDSEGELTELLVRDGKFSGFAPGSWLST